MAPKLRSTRKTRSSEVAQPTTTTTAEAQHGSTCLFQGSDTIVLILGQTGAGKSTFINYALDSETAPVGHGLDSYTDDIHHYPMDLGGRRIVLVDTPGFNDTWAIDHEIMRRIVRWLETSCQPSTKCAGIIYLYEITQARANPRDGYMHPMKLEKPDAPKYVILATVKWREVPPAVGQMRETQLNIAWKKMLDRGSRIARFGDTTESARAIVNMFENPTTVEEILKELNHILGRLPKDTVDKKSGAGFISKLFGRLWGTS